MTVKRLGVLGSALIMMALGSTSLFATEIQKGTILEDAEAFASVEDTSKRSCYVYEGEQFTIVDETDDFYGILIEDEEIVYIEKDVIEVEEEQKAEEEALKKEEEVLEEQKAEAPAPKEVEISKGEQVVKYAKQFIGTPYVSGGTSLTSGVDCSGFSQQVYLKFGVKLERTSRGQYASNGTSVSKAQLKPGDLVFYGYNGSVCHVAIYVGNSQVIHAPVPGKSVCIVPMSQRGDAPIIGYKRIFKD